MAQPDGLPDPTRERRPACGPWVVVVALAVVAVFVVVPAVIYFLWGGTLSGCMPNPRAAAVRRFHERLGEASSRVREEKWDEAIALYDKALADKPPDTHGELLAAVYAMRSHCHGAKKDYDRAIADLSQAIAIFPNEPRHHALRGFYHARKDEIGPALADFSKAIELRPNDPDLYTRRAQVWRKNGDDDKALADHDEAVRRGPRSADALFERAFTRYCVGDFERAANDWRTCTRLGGDHANYRPLWIYTATTQAGGDGKAELAAFRRQLKDDTWPNPIARMLLGEIDPDQLLALAEKPGSETPIEQACEAHYFIAIHHLAAGRRPLALTHLQKALDTGVTHFYEYEAAQVDLARLPLP